jgi:hypothetical protein
MDMFDISKRLERRFGVGSKPELRRTLYHRLELLVERLGEPAYKVIAIAAAEADGKNEPGRWFAKVVCLRLREHGLEYIPEL